MKKKLFLIAALAVAAAAAASYVLRMDQGDGMAYLTEPVTAGNITRTVNATGEVGAVQLVSVGAQVGGQIKKLHVVLGQDVKKGDLIAEIDSVPQLNQLETDKARLQSYESQLAAKKVALKIAKTKYDREMQLKKRDAASKESLEDAENAYALAKAEVTELESQIRQAQIAVNTDEVNLGYTRITAPLDGTIVSVPVDEGQTVNANQTTPTIVQIADLDKMEIKIEISEGDITAVKPGMPITYTILSNPETEYKATLTSIDPGLTTLTDGSYKTTSSTGSSASSSSSSSSNNAVYYYGKALIDNKEGPLRIGMTTQNVITVADVKDALLVPVIAVQSRNGKKFVRVLGPGDKPERREVTTGIADGIHILRDRAKPRPCAEGHVLCYRGGRFRRHHRTVRIGQVDAHEHPGLSRHPVFRGLPHRRRGHRHAGQRRARGTAREAHRVHLPALQPALHTVRHGKRGPSRRILRGGQKGAP